MINEINPIIHELSESSDFKIPATISNVVLMAPGMWNDVHYSSDDIQEAFQNTDWGNKDVVSLIADHADKPLSVNDWLGWVKNPRLENDAVIGDLEIYDESSAMKLLKAKAKFGISPKVAGFEDDSRFFRNFTFENFSLVTNPACKKAYINLSEEKRNELAKITNMEAMRKKLGMSVSEFYAVPKDPPSSSKLPIFDKAHTQNALARFNQTQFDSDAQKKTAMSRIIKAAKKFGIKVSDEMYDLNKLKGGINMTDKKLEEEKQESSEDPKEESKEEKSEEEMKVKNTMDKILSVVEGLDKRLKKLEEEEKPEEVKEEPKEEPTESKTESEEESEESELSQLRKEVQELSSKLNEPRARTVHELSGHENTLFPNRHSPGVLEMVNILRENAKRM